MRSQLVQRLGGLAMMLVAGSLTYYTWQWARSTGEYLGVYAFLPGWVIFGLGLLFVPIDWKQHRERFGTNRIKNWEQAPAAWKVIIAVAILVGLGDVVVLEILTRVAEAKQSKSPRMDQASRQQEDSSRSTDTPKSEATPRSPDQIALTSTRGPNDNLVLICLFIALIGAFVAIFGMVWDNLEAALPFFTGRAHAARGIIIVVIGFLMMVAGMTVAYLSR